MNNFTVNIIISRKHYKDFTIGVVTKFRPYYAQGTFWISIILPLIGIYLVAKQMMTEGRPDNPFIYFCFAIPATAILMRILARYKGGLAYDADPNIHKPTDHIFDEQQVMLKRVDFEATFPWKQIMKLKVTKDYVVLYVSAKNIIMLPTDQLIDEEVAFIRAQFAKRK